MRTLLPARRFALVLAGVLACVLIVFAQRSTAGAVYIVHGHTTAVCEPTGRTVPASYQDSYFGSELHGFWDRERVEISFGFPDGRHFSAYAVELLDGVVNMPPNYKTVFDADIAGDLYFDFPINNKWPYGCYTFTAVGTSSGQTARGQFVVTPRPNVAPPASPARLDVWRNGTFESSGEHDSVANIHGRFFFPNEVISIWITQPDGSVIDYPQQIASDIGNFESSFTFTNVHMTGRYTFTAFGTRSGYQVFAPFELRGRSSTPSGWATLRVAAPYPAATNQNGGLVVTGAMFSNGEPVGLWMTLPDNSVRSLPTQVADGNGDFYAVIELEERLPVGTYHVTANGVYSGRLVIASFEVTDGAFQGVYADVPPEQVLPAPFVTETNVGEFATGGPTNTTNTVNEWTPQDIGSQGCDTPEQYWSPSC